jgi:hypothetical protein
VGLIYGRFLAVHRLLAAGASLDFLFSNGKNPLEWVMDCSYVCTYLALEGAKRNNVDWRNEWGVTYWLLLAARDNNTDIINEDPISEEKLRNKLYEAYYNNEEVMEEANEEGPGADISIMEVIKDEAEDRDEEGDRDALTRCQENRKKHRHENHPYGERRNSSRSMTPSPVPTPSASPLPMASILPVFAKGNETEGVGQVVPVA